ncbi:MAG: DJ-1/PfpI family protein [Clostridia bacterium]|nr:DJ-1/PfpI family protein [Clostridia bacterium]
MVYVFLADGFEETEAIAPIDIMRRAGLEVVTVGIGGQLVRGAHNITVMADMDGADAIPDETVDAVVLPGGLPGTVNLENNQTVQAFLDYAAANDKVMAAICAAPSVLGHKGLLEGKRAVCFPGYEKELRGAKVQNTPAEIDGNIVTACGAGAALEFGFALVERLCDQQTAKKLEQIMQCGR